jgi:hypothetical protein
MQQTMPLRVSVGWNRSIQEVSPRLAVLYTFVTLAS